MESRSRQSLQLSRAAVAGLEHLQERTKGMFSSRKFLDSATVALLFLFGNYCPIID